MKTARSAFHGRLCWKAGLPRKPWNATAAADPAAAAQAVDVAAATDDPRVVVTVEATIAAEAAVVITATENRKK